MSETKKVSVSEFNSALSVCLAFASQAGNAFLAMLLGAIEIARKAPKVKTFDPAPLRKVLESMEMSEKDIAAQIDHASKKHAEKFGDGQTVALVSIFGSLGGIDLIEQAVKTERNREREELAKGKLAFTGKAVESAIEGAEDALESVKKVVKAIAIARASENPVQWSELETTHNLTTNARQAVQMTFSKVGEKVWKEYAKA